MAAKPNPPSRASSAVHAVDVGLAPALARGYADERPASTPSDVKKVPFLYG
jgi:hypothetical protein